MPKLSAALSKKVPMPGLEYSSQNFSCGLEMELTGEVTAESLRQSARKLYVILHDAIDQEIRDSLERRPEYLRELQSRPGQERERSQPERESYGRQPRWNNARGNYGGNSRGRFGGDRKNGQATQAQVKAIFAIAKTAGLSRDDLLDSLQEQFGLPKPEQLTVSQASQFIGDLKERVRE